MPFGGRRATRRVDVSRATGCGKEGNGSAAGVSAGGSGVGLDPTTLGFTFLRPGERSGALRASSVEFAGLPCRWRPVQLLHRSLYVPTIALDGFHV